MRWPLSVGASAEELRALSGWGRFCGLDLVGVNAPDALTLAHHARSAFAERPDDDAAVTAR
jgi:hypothetical protein